MASKPGNRPEDGVLKRQKSKRAQPFPAKPFEFLVGDVGIEPTTR